MQGRWSLTAPLFENAPPAGPRLRAQAELMLERYGIVTREAVLAEGVPGGFASLYGEMSNLEMLGTARRGYFVEGLGGAQFALPGAVERLRSLPHAEGATWCSPPPTRRTPTAPACPGPSATARPGRPAPSRTPGAYVLLRDGEPMLFVERGGRGILRLRELEGEALAEAVGELAAAPARAVAAARDRAGRRRAGDRLGARGDADRGRLPRQPRRLVASA